VLQDVDTLFEVDSVRPVLAMGEQLSGVAYGASERTDVSLRIMADHARAVTALISDRVVPSNEGRGYVLRRLLRRAVRHAHLLGCGDLVMPQLIESTVEVLGEAYPVLHDQKDAITEMAVREETRFRRTLESGHQLLDDELDRLDDGAVFPGAVAFKLHDTFGFPRELTEEILTEKGIQLDLEEFHEMMTQQRERARRSFKGGDAAEKADAYRALLRGIDGTRFLGYTDERVEGTVLAIIREGDAVERAESGQDVEVFLEATPFYAESGGQVGDTGTLTTATGEIRVRDTQYALPGLHGHVGRVVRGYVQAGQEVVAAIDGQRREDVRKNHTGTHLLHWALREIVGDHAHQAGSLVEPERLRFDFSHYDSLAGEEIRAVERVVNDRIYANTVVSTLETSKAEAEKMGALAFFGDKYGEHVRVVRVGDYSVEFCGGTHVRSTGQVGPLILVSEGSVAANTRRVEALTGSAAYGMIVDLRSRIEDAENVLRAQPGQLVVAAASLAARLRDQEERIEEFEAKARSGLAATILDTSETLGAHTVVAAAVDDIAPGDLRALAFQVRDRLGSGVGVLGSSHGGKGALVVWVSDDLVQSGISAGDIIAAGARVLGGGGSRDPALAQAGGPRGDEIEAAVTEAAQAAREALAGS
jgi:alanyl-tRNA synthetase